MMHSPAFVIIFRRLRQISEIVNTGSVIARIDENGFHDSSARLENEHPPIKPGTTSLDTSLGDEDFNRASFQSLI